MSGDPPIIINGRGSISIEFPEGTFPPETAGKGKFKNQNKHIDRIEITGKGAPAYNQTVTGKDVVITIHYK